VIIRDSHDPRGREVGPARGRVRPVGSISVVMLGAALPNLLLGDDLPIGPPGTGWARYRRRPCRAK